MYAQLTIVCEKDLPQDLKPTLKSRMGDPTDLQEALSATTYAGMEDMGSRVIYCQLDDRQVFLVLREGADTLKVHIESTLAPDDLADLKTSIKTMTGKFNRYLQFHGTKSSSFEVEIRTDEAFLQFGRYFSSWRDVLSSSVMDNLFTEVYVGLAAWLLSQLFGYDSQTVGRNILAALLATTLYLLVTTRYRRGSIQYTEETT